MTHWFTRFAHRAATMAGSYLTFLAALALILGWAITGPFFGFSETWQLVINTGTTIITFLMVFLIQNTQNRDALAMQLKLDEIIRAIEGADNAFIRAEESTTEELEELRRQYESLYAAHSELKAKVVSKMAHGTWKGHGSGAIDETCLPDPDTLWDEARAQDPVLPASERSS